MIRIIPRLDIKGPNLVKGIHFEGLRVLGKPEDFARDYYKNGADELIYMDAVASLYGRNSLLNIVEKTAKTIFIPLTVGGGIRTLNDIRQTLRAGADKVSLNTAAIKRPEFIREAARVFGSSTVVVSIEAIKHPDGRYEAYVDYGRESTGKDAIHWAIQAAAFGAGEIVITSINREGTGRGFDCDLVRRISESVSIPVIAAGGAGNIEHVASVIREGRVDAVSVASLLHYNTVRKFKYNPKDFKEEGNVEFLFHGSRRFSAIKDVGLRTLKEELKKNGLDVRLGTGAV
jgi:imidazole glycerol-phosphate synthase subunit HisF